MDQNKEIVAALQQFVSAADNSDTASLGKVLHEKYQNVQDGFFEQKGIFCISKDEYLKLIETKKFGGTPRTVEIKKIREMGNMAVANAVLESKFLIFDSFIVLTREADDWKVIGNYPEIKLEKP